MRNLEPWIEETIAELTVTEADLQRGMARFEEEMALGLRTPGASSLYMEPCYVDLPTGRERGRAVALDFGGTNARAALVEVTAGGCRVLGAARRPLRVSGAYDVTRSETPEALFDFLAELVREALVKGGARTDEALPLGHTFSFGTRQQELSDARLIVWSKEIEVPGVEGEYVNAQLRAALARAGLRHVAPTAILNDTTAVLLAAAFRHPGTAIATIYATGFNSCYLETFGGRRPPMIYNIESGSYRHFPQSALDRALDAASSKPGAQRLEKMISGRYLGELLTRALQRGGQADAPLLSGEAVGQLAAGALRALPGGAPLTETARAGLGALARALIRRSARLAGMTLAAVLSHRAAVDGQDVIARQPLAMDGAVFAYMPGVEAELRGTLSLLLGRAAQGLTLPLVRDASSEGAAIAALLGAEKMKGCSKAVGGSSCTHEEALDRRAHRGLSSDKYD